MENYFVCGTETIAETVLTVTQAAFVVVTDATARRIKTKVLWDMTVFPLSLYIYSTQKKVRSNKTP